MFEFDLVTRYIAESTILLINYALNPFIFIAGAKVEVYFSVASFSSWVRVFFLIFSNISTSWIFAYFIVMNYWLEEEEETTLGWLSSETPDELLWLLILRFSTLIAFLIIEWTSEPTSGISSFWESKLTLSPKFFSGLKNPLS